MRSILRFFQRILLEQLSKIISKKKRKNFDWLAPFSVFEYYFLKVGDNIAQISCLM